MNSWLGFSLSPQELASQAQSLDGAQAVSGECFDLPPGSTSNHFGIMEAFNSGHQHQGHCSMSDIEQYNLICNQNLSNRGNKFEDFLGGQSYDNEQNLSQCNNASLSLHSQSFGNPGDYVFSNIGGEGGGSINGCVGMSTIKTWLRNQPAPQRESENNGDIDMHNISSSGSLSLSMGTCSESSSSMQLRAASANAGGQSSVGNNNMEIVASGLDGQSESNEIVPRKTVDTFGQRTSIYRGVTRHRWTGRYEAHLWDNSCRREGQTRKGRQVYLGGYDKEEKAARAYDLAALKYWGTTTTTNFPISDYEQELEVMKNMTRQEYVASLRRKSSGFSRGASIYRGVTRHHQHGRWQARIGRVAGNKDLYLGTFNTQEEAAEAYDIAAIKFRGLNAVTNFDMSRYDVKSILESSTLPIGGAARRLKEIEQTEANIDNSSGTANDRYLVSQLTDYSSSYYGSRGWASLPFQQIQPLSMQYPYNESQITGWLKQEHENVGAHHESLQELHQLHLSNTQNLFQPTGLQNLMGLDPTAFEHSSTPDSSAYFSGDGAATNNVTTFADPLNSKVDGQSREGHWRKPGYEYDDHLNPLHHPTGIWKANNDEQSGNWMHSSILPLCHGPQTFTVWNDTEK